MTDAGTAPASAPVSDGSESAPIVGLDALPDNLHWPVPPLVGVGETAAILGVSKQRVHQLLRSGFFPAPIARLAATPVWRESDVRWYAANRDTIRRSLARVAALGLMVTT